MLKRVKIIDEKIRTRLLLHLSAARSLLSNWSVKSVRAPTVYNIGFQGILLFFPELQTYASLILHSKDRVTHQSIRSFAKSV